MSDPASIALDLPPVLRRPADWPQRLADFLAERQSTAFTWERHNCAFFACDWLARLLGVDPAAAWRDEVGSALAAHRALVGGGGLEAMAVEACVRWRWPECPVAYARRGDLVLVETEAEGPALGIAEGATAVFVSAFGLARVPLRQCRRAWRVG